MKTGLVYSERFLEHETGPGHPERVDRLKAIVRHLKETRLWDQLEHLIFEPAALSWIEKIHDPDYIERFRQACQTGAPLLDSMDCRICKASYDIARLAVGGILAAVDAVMNNKVHNAVCLLRPPGHHAEFDIAMGFCYFNNIAVAARYLIEQYELGKVAIVDFDVHHGNGTQHLLETRSDILFISIHESPETLFPGTGFAHERGRGPGEGFTLNIPMPPYSGDEDYRIPIDQQVIPALEDYRPEFLLVSAGYDPAELDPLAHQQLSIEMFGEMTAKLKAAAERLCHGRLVSTLEGGYHLNSLARGVEQHILALQDE